jgi:hypothetical protein
MDHLCSKGKESTRDRRRREMATKPIHTLRDKIITQTAAEDFFEALKRGTNSTNHALRLLHNLALAMGWLPWPLIRASSGPKLHPEEDAGSGWRNTWR